MLVETTRLGKTAIRQEWEQREGNCANPPLPPPVTSQNRKKILIFYEQTI
jgi:hypothetical protein